MGKTRLSDVCLLSPSRRPVEVDQVGLGTEYFGGKVGPLGILSRPNTSFSVSRNLDLTQWHRPPNFNILPYVAGTWALGRL